MGCADAADKPAVSFSGLNLKTTHQTTGAVYSAPVSNFLDVSMNFNRKICALIGAISLLIGTPSAFAADKKGAYAIDGGGGAPCKAFTESRRAADERAAGLFAGWVDGYVSAANQTRPDTYDLTPWQTTDLLLVLLARYCETYPEDRFEIAVNNMLNALHPTRLTERSDKLIAGSAAKGVPVYRETLRDAQKSLAEQGFYTGPIDGNYGKALNKALIAFQKKNGLKATGLPEQETLYRLLPLTPETGASGPK